MLPDADTCYRALVARDHRFDGVFFAGLTTTGVYCRPVCPARAPRRHGCVFFATTADAEREGFCACLRCRPGLAPGSPSVDSPARLRLDYLPPIAWEPLLSFLGARAVPGVEEVGAGVYRRAVSLGGRTGWVAVERDPARASLVATVSRSLARTLVPLASRLRRLFDLDAHPAEIDRRLARDPTLGVHVRAVPGLRVPGAFDGFEAAVRAVLGQQVTVKGAATLAGRLASRLGPAVETPLAGLRHAFPAPAALAARAPAEVASLGMPLARASALVALARAVEGGLVLEPGVDVGATLARLRELPGFGEWTAQYVAMRALAWPDAFPAADLGVRRALGATRPEEATARAEAWRPWRAYATLHLWTRGAGPPAHSTPRRGRRRC